LAHADIGSDDAARDAELAAAIAPLINGLVREQGFVVTDRSMSMPKWISHPLPPDGGDWPYYIYRVG
ncbi:MAG: hypothetical protein OER43_18200, partial [Gammaproteobacteria bacterium]|nr:hypothetical protein [Gammaproteobacteria bacterium]